jgi:hypothetical protein
MKYIFLLQINKSLQQIIHYFCNIRNNNILINFHKFFQIPFTFFILILFTNIQFQLSNTKNRKYILE